MKINFSAYEKTITKGGFVRFECALYFIYTHHASSWDYMMGKPPIHNASCNIYFFNR